MKAPYLIPNSVKKIAAGAVRSKVVITIADIQDITDLLELNGVENVLSIPSEKRIDMVIDLAKKMEG